MLLVKKVDFVLLFRLGSALALPGIGLNFAFHFFTVETTIPLSHIAYRHNQFIAIPSCEPFYMCKYVLLIGCLDVTTTVQAYWTNGFCGGLVKVLDH